jgi:hypothetical protein
VPIATLKNVRPPADTIAAAPDCRNAAADVSQSTEKGLVGGQGAPAEPPGVAIACERVDGD